MDDEKRANILANISEDMAELFRHEFLRLGREAFYSKAFEEPRWAWRYTGERPDDAFDYAFDRNNGAFKSSCMPNWASKKAVFDVFREEIERDYQTWLAEHADEEEDDNADDDA